MARLTYGVLCVLGLVGWGCAGAKPQQPVAKQVSAGAQADASADCPGHAALKARVDAAVAVGNWLGARRLVEQSGLQCAEAQGARFELDSASASPSGDVDALLASASQARGQGKLEDARRAEASAVLLLETRSHERLRVLQRWSVDDPHVLPHVPYAFMTLDQQVLIVDVHSGRLHARIPQPAQDQFEIDLDAKGTRVLARSVDLAKIGGEQGCASNIDIFDAGSGVRLKQECAMSWAFSGDGSRLALARLVGWGDGAIMKLVVLDTKTLEPVVELPEPGNIGRLSFAPDGTTLVTRWSHGISLTDVVSGKTETWSAPARETVSDVSFGGGYAVWQLGSTAHIWNLAGHTRTTLDLGACDLAALSSSGARLAARCPGGVTIWSLPRGARTPARPLSSFSLPKDSKLWSLSFLRGERTLGVELIGANESSSKPALYDSERRHWLLLPQPSGDFRKLDPDLGLLLMGKSNAPLELFAVDRQARLRRVSLPSCEPIELVKGHSDGSAIVTCRSQQLLAVVLDLDTLASRSFPVGATAQTVHGKTLVGSYYSALELRELSTGALLAGSPVGPAATAWDGWWDGSAFVTVAARDDQDEVHVARFGAQLSREVLPPPSTDPCKEHRGRVAWSQRPPYVLCQRKDGAPTGQLPEKELAGGQFEVPALSDDGSFAIASRTAGHAYRVADGAQIPLAERPRGLQFAGPELLVGYDEAYDWGFWSASTGRRLTHSQEKLENLPIAASAALNLAVEPGRPLLVVRDFAGNRIGTIPVDQHGDVALSEHGVVSVVEPSRVSFFQLPQRERLGVLLNHPSTGEVAFLAATGELELTGEPVAWRQLLRCQVGARELPLEVCLDAWLEPGIGARRLLPGRSDL